MDPRAYVNVANFLRRFEYILKYIGLKKFIYFPKQIEGTNYCEINIEIVNSERREYAKIFLELRNNEIFFSLIKIPFISSLMSMETFFDLCKAASSCFGEITEEELLSMVLSIKESKYIHDYFYVLWNIAEGIIIFILIPRLDVFVDKRFS